MTTNQIAYWNMRENRRNNQVVAKETNRHNLAMENLQLGANQETARSNKAKEGLTLQQNIEKERSNKANEAIGAANVVVREGELAETTRSHQANENINLMNLAETQRHNIRTENITAAYNAESIRVQDERNREVKRDNLINEKERFRHDFNTEQETNRTNVENENIKRLSALSGLRSGSASQKGASTNAMLADFTMGNQFDESKRKTNLNFVSGLLHDMTSTTNTIISSGAKLVSLGN